MFKMILIRQSSNNRKLNENNFIKEPDKTMKVLIEILSRQFLPILSNFHNNFLLVNTKWCKLDRKKNRTLLLIMDAHCFTDRAVQRMFFLTIHIIKTKIYIL